MWAVSHAGNLNWVAGIVTTGISLLRFGLLIFWAVVPLSLFAQSGFVKSGGQALPGATVTAAQNGQSFSTVTDADGHYTFPPLASGAWSVSVDMFGFQPFKKDVDYSAANGPVNFNLELKESPMLQRLRQAADRMSGGAGRQPGNGRTIATTASDQALEQERAAVQALEQEPERAAVLEQEQAAVQLSVPEEQW